MGVQDQVEGSASTLKKKRMLIYFDMQGRDPGAGKAFVTNGDPERSLFRLVSNHLPMTKQQASI